MNNPKPRKDIPEGDELIPEENELPGDWAENIDERRQEIQTSLNNPDLSLKYENRKNLGMSKEDIEHHIREGIQYNNTWRELYRVCHALVTQMEKMILNTEEIPARAIDNSYINRIMDLREQLALTYNNMEKGEDSILTEENEPHIQELIEKINDAEDTTLKQFRILLSKTIAEDLINYYNLNEGGRHLCNYDEYGRMTFLRGIENCDYNLESFGEILFGNITRSEEYLDQEGGEKTGVTSTQRINRGDETYRVDYSNASSKIRQKVKDKAKTKSDKCLSGTLCNIGGNITYTYYDEQKHMHAIDASDLPIGEGVTIQEEGGHEYEKDFKIVNTPNTPPLETRIDTNQDKRIDAQDIIKFLDTDYDNFDDVVGLGNAIESGTSFSSYSTFSGPDSKNLILIRAIEEAVSNKDFQEKIQKAVEKGEGGLGDLDIKLLYLQAKLEQRTKAHNPLDTRFVVENKNAQDFYSRYGGRTLLNYIRSKYNNPKYEFRKGWPELFPSIQQQPTTPEQIKIENIPLPKLNLSVDSKAQFDILKNRAYDNFRTEYETERTNSIKRNAEKGKNKDAYTELDLYIFGLKKYQELIDAKHKLIRGQIYGSEEELKRQQELAEEYFKKIEKENNEYPNIQEITQKLIDFQERLNNIKKEHLGEEKEEDAESKYKEYAKKVDKKREEMGINNIKSLSKEPSEQDDPKEYFDDIFKLITFEAEQEKIKKNYGDSINNYENYMEAKGELVKEKGENNIKQRIDIYNKYQSKIKSCEDRRENNGFDIEKYRNYIENLSNLDIPGHLDNLNKLYERLDTKNLFFPIEAIKRDRVAAIIKQNQADARWKNLHDWCPLLYQICNIGARGINAFISATLGTGAKLGALITSLWHDDNEMVAVRERTENWLRNPHFNISRKQQQSVYENGKINFNWDNGPGIIAESIVNMLVLIEGGGVIAKMGTRAATRMGIGMSTKVASGTGLFASGFIQEVGNSYKEGFQAGMRGNQAMLYCLVNAGIQGGLELISPNEFLLGGGKNLAKSYILEILRSGEKKSLMAIGKSFLGNVGKEIVEENAQEALQLVAGNLVNMWANDQFELGEIGGTKGLGVDWNKNNFVATALITTITTGLVASGGFAKHNKTLNEKSKNALLIYIAQNENLNSNVNNILDKAIAGEISLPNINQQQLQELKTKLESYKTIKGNGNIAQNTSEGETTTGETNEGETSEGETTTGETSEGETTTGETSEGETTTEIQRSQLDGERTREPTQLRDIEESEFQEIEQDKILNEMLNELVDTFGSTNYDSFDLYLRLIRNRKPGQSLSDAFRTLDLSGIDTSIGTICTGMARLLQARLAQKGINSYMIRFKAGGTKNNEYLGDGHTALIVPRRLEDGSLGYILLDPGLMISQPIPFSEHETTAIIPPEAPRYQIKYTGNTEYPFSMLIYKKDAETGKLIIDKDIPFNPTQERINPEQTLNIEILRVFTDFKISKINSNGKNQGLLRLCLPSDKNPNPLIEIRRRGEDGEMHVFNKEKMLTIDEFKDLKNNPGYGDKKPKYGDFLKACEALGRDPDIMYEELLLGLDNVKEYVETIQNTSPAK